MWILIFRTPISSTENLISYQNNKKSLLWASSRMREHNKYFFQHFVWNTSTKLQLLDPLRIWRKKYFSLHHVAQVLYTNIFILILLFFCSYFPIYILHYIEAGSTLDRVWRQITILSESRSWSCVGMTGSVSKHCAPL